MHLSELPNVFVQIDKSICPKYQMYLSKYQMYLSKLPKYLSKIPSVICPKCIQKLKIYLFFHIGKCIRPNCPQKICQNLKPYFSKLPKVFQPKKGKSSL